MGRWICFATLATFALVAGANAQVIPANDDEAAIYAEVLDTLFVTPRNLLLSPDHKPLKQLVILDTTDATARREASRQLRAVIPQTLPGIPDSLVEAYIAANVTPTRVRLIPGLRSGQTLISDVELQGMFPPNGAGGGWEQFRQLHPEARGYVILAHVGFDRARNRAVVYVGNTYDGRAGLGLYVLVKRVKGGWRVERIGKAWDS